MWTAFLLLAALQSSAPPEGDRLRAALAFFERGPGAVGPDGRVEASIGAGSRTRPPVISWFVPGFPGVYNVWLQNTGSGLQEQFLVQPASPPPPPGQVKPLLVLFHGAGTSHMSPLLHSTFFAEAASRGW